MVGDSENDFGAGEKETTLFSVQDEDWYLSTVVFVQCVLRHQCHMMRVFKGRRTYKLLFLILAAALVYLGFQVFSVRILTKQNIRSAHNIVGKHAGELLSKEKYVKDKEERKYRDKVKKPTPDQPEPGERQFHIPDIPRAPDFPAKDNDKLNVHRDKNDGDMDVKNIDLVDIRDLKLTWLRPADVPRGVGPEKVSLYKRGDGKFTCLNSKEIIPFKWVNDDYCDCKDGSDEPGTSACPDNRFFCDFQIIARPFSIFSSTVNDGICDCCDGSDEWGNVTVMEWFKINDNKHYPVSHAPCKNTCHMQEKKLLSEQKLKQAGAQLKEKYLLYAQERKKTSDISAYGPQGIFFKLSVDCFIYKTSEYEYKLCPWTEVRQQAFPHASKCLGRVTTWLSHSNGVYKLQMAGGDRDLCPDHSDRQTIITFTCGLEDKITSVYENERCRYSIDFITPAAC